MHLAYFDEVKYQANNQPYFWFGCLLVPSARVVELENAVATLSLTQFGRSTLARDTEFHASDIFRGKSNFRGVDLATRVETLKQLCSIICQHDDVGRIFVQLDPAKMHSTRYIEKKAFIFLVERVEMELRQLKTYGMLIGDKERDKLSSVFAEDLSRYRESSTPFQYGRDLRNLVDTVHFTESHLSRMLQLADTYTFLKQLCSRDPQTHPGKEIVRFIREETDFGYARIYKRWPN